MRDVVSGLRQSITTAKNTECLARKIVIDPGIGFAKTMHKITIAGKIAGTRGSLVTP